MVHACNIRDGGDFDVYIPMDEFVKYEFTPSELGFIAEVLAEERIQRVKWVLSESKWKRAGSVPRQLTDVFVPDAVNFICGGVMHNPDVREFLIWNYLLMTNEDPLNGVHWGAYLPGNHPNIYYGAMNFAACERPREYLEFCNQQRKGPFSLDDVDRYCERFGLPEKMMSSLREASTPFVGDELDLFNYDPNYIAGANQMA